MFLIGLGIGIVVGAVGVGVVHTLINYFNL